MSPKAQNYFISPVSAELVLNKREPVWGHFSFLSCRSLQSILEQCFQGETEVPVDIF